jgi:6-phosphogluconolactonase
MSFVEYADRDMLAIDLADKIANELVEALHHAPRATLVVPGGTTPGPIFDDLCAVDLGWDRVAVMLSDERWVPTDHPRSNAALLRKRLLVGPAEAANFIPFYDGSPSAEAMIAAQEPDIRAKLPISVALLGMGDDMHTASLFPRGDNLRLALDLHAPTLIPMRVDGVPEQRISLSAPVLRDALRLHIVITGDDKKAALERAQTLPAEEAPVRAILDKAVVHWAP